MRPVQQILRKLRVLETVAFGQQSCLDGPLKIEVGLHDRHLGLGARIVHTEHHVTGLHLLALGHQNVFDDTALKVLNDPPVAFGHDNTRCLGCAVELSRRGP